MYDSFIAALEHLAKGTQGLSGVMGSYHAPFLGEGATATSPPYPTFARRCCLLWGLKLGQIVLAKLIFYRRGVLCSASSYGIGYSCSR